MDNPLLSVIIPVYNVEKYLDECVMSVINQTYKNIEVILVDDGSPDRSGWMCDEWAKKDVRVKVVHKQNEGLGFARNSGMKVASGEYVTFIDSDDFIAPDMYGVMIKEAVKNDCDIVYSGGFNKYLTNGSFHKVNDVDRPMVFHKDKIEDLSYCFISPDNNLLGRRLIMSACRAIYRMKIVPDFYSEREVTSEDLPFNVRSVLNSEVVSLIPDIFYWYRYNDSSLTRTFCFDKYERYKCLMNVLNGIYEIVGSHYRAEYCMMVSVIDIIRGMYLSDVKFLERREYIKRMALDVIWDEFSLDVSKMSIGNKLIYRLLKSHSPFILQVFTECYYFVRKRFPH